MTKRELSQLYHLNREIESQKRRLAGLEASASACTANITGMPSACGISDRVGAYAAEIADLKSIIALNIQKCWYETNRLNRYINSIEDSQTREIFRLRYINGLSWQQVAFSLGEHDESVVRKRHNRFLKVSEISE